MSHRFFRLLRKLILGLAVVLTACASPTGVGTPQPLTADQAATIAVATQTGVPALTGSPIQSPTASAAIGQSAVVAFVKDGDILVWEEATGQSKTIFEAGDVIACNTS